MTHYINIEFDPATWTKRIENGRSKWVSPPIALPAGWTTATAIITFDGMMAAITPIADDSVGRNENLRSRKVGRSQAGQPQ